MSEALADDMMQSQASILKWRALDHSVLIAGRTFKYGLCSWKIRPAADALLASAAAYGPAIESMAGPFDTMKDAMASILQAHKRTFGVMFSRSCIGNSKSGPKQEISCASRKCPFHMNYELCTVGSSHGWVLIKMEDTHSNHQFSETLTQKNSSVLQRDLPKDVLADAKLLFTVGQMAVAQIQSYFEKEFDGTREITWTMKDLSNALAGDPSCKLFLDESIESSKRRKLDKL